MTSHSLPACALGLLFTGMPTMAQIQQGTAATGDQRVPATAPDVSTPTAFYWADYDLDGLDDAFSIAGGLGSLLHNEGDGSFADVTLGACLESGVAVRQASWGDYNGDGWQDLLLVGADGSVSLWRSDLGVCFTSSTEEAGLNKLTGVRSAAWLDYDKDGVLDLHLVRGQAHQVLHGSADGLFSSAATGLAMPTEVVGGVRSTVKVPTKMDGASTPEGAPKGTRTGVTGGSSGGGRSSAMAGSGTSATLYGGPLSLASSSFICAGSVEDTANPGTCVLLSTVPTLGMIYPLGPEFNIDSATGRVGIGTTTPAAVLHLKGDTARLLRLEGTDHAYMEFYPVPGSPRGGYFGFDSGSSDHITIKNETATGGIRLQASGPVQIPGDLGIGTTNPTEKLHVVGTVFAIRHKASSSMWTPFMEVSSSTGPSSTVNKWAEVSAHGGAHALFGSNAYLEESDNSVRFANDHSSLGASGMYVNGPTGSASWNSVSIFVNPGPSVADATFTPNVVATFKADGTTRVKKLEITGGSDLVEGFETSSGKIASGTVVVIDPENPGKLITSTEAYDKKVAGVVSGAGGVDHGLRLGQNGVLDGETLVAMTGRVYVKCSAEGGAIEPGDLLTSASLEGHAMKASDGARLDGTVLGKAMSKLESGTGLVLILVNLQ